jgi:hypothetical protein
MIIIVPIVLLTIGAFISVIVNMTGDVLAARGSNVLSYNIQDTLNRIEQDVKLSTGFLATNNISFDSVNNPQGFNGATSNFYNVNTVDSDPSTSDGNILILNELATTGNPLSLGNGVVYLNNQPNSCSSNATQVNQNTPMTMNVIYFIKSGSLWRRTIAPVNYLTTGATTAGCNQVPWQQPSCSPGYSSTFCKTEDIKLVDVSSINDFSIQYYNGAGSNTANSAASDTSITPGPRNSALQSATTVSASLNISQNVAGRAISQAGTIRATRLDVNASTIADVVQAVIPATPVVNGSINPNTPSTVDFSWNSVPGATTYTLNYTLDGGGANQYVSGLTNSTATSYSVTGNHGKIICATVYANSSIGSSSAGNTCVTIPLFTPMLLQNNWVNFDSTNTRSPATFTKTSSGMVMLEGIVKSGTSINSTIIATLPVGYRPAHNLIFQNATNGVAGRVDVWTDGTVRFQIGSNAWFSLDDINFMPSGVGTWNALTLQNGWVNNSDIFINPLSYMVDSMGRTRISGMINGGTTTSGTVIANIPAATAPPLYIHVDIDAGNANGHISIDPTNNAIVEKNYSNAWHSIQALYYPRGYPASASCPAATTGWCGFTFQNSWQNYLASTYSTGAYTKGADGVVQLKGLLNGGAIGTVVTNLPVGYRPAHQLLIAIESGNFGAVDIYPNGNVMVSIGATGWSALDSVNFMAEQ